MIARPSDSAADECVRDHDAHGEEGLHGPRVAVWIDPAGEVMVDKAVRVGPLAAVASERLLPGRERTIEPDRDADQAECNGREMRPNQSRPTEREHPTDGNERQVDEMQDNDRVGKPDQHDRTTVASTRRTAGARGITAHSARCGGPLGRC